MTPEILEEDSSEHQEEMPVIDSSLTKAEIEACEEQCKNHFQDSGVFSLEKPTVNPFTEDNPVYHSRKLIQNSESH